jgi:hypothetical protein
VPPIGQDMHSLGARRGKSGTGVPEGCAALFEWILILAMLYIYAITMIALGIRFDLPFNAPEETVLRHDRISPGCHGSAAEVAETPMCTEGRIDGLSLAHAKGSVEREDP